MFDETIALFIPYREWYWKTTDAVSGTLHEVSTKSVTDFFCTAVNMAKQKRKDVFFHLSETVTNRHSYVSCSSTCSHELSTDWGRKRTDRHLHHKVTMTGFSFTFTQKTLTSLATFVGAVSEVRVWHPLPNHLLSHERRWGQIGRGTACSLPYLLAKSQQESMTLCLCNLTQWPSQKTRISCQQDTLLRNLPEVSACVEMWYDSDRLCKYPHLLCLNFYH